MSARSKFWDRIADRYARKPVPDEAAYRRKLQVTRDHLRPDMEVLEIGCGTGSTAIAHAPHVSQILAIDISSRMIEIAQDKANASEVANVTFERAAIDEFSAPDRTFDAALGLSILHLLEDMDGAIAKLHRMLKPGGVFVSNTACIGDMRIPFGLIGPIGRALGLMPFFRVFTRAELEASLIRGGFDIDHCWQPGKGKAVFIVARKA